jgi:hypothetical protein
MKGVLLSIAATIVLASSASAQMGSSSGFGGGMNVHRPGFNNGFTGRPARRHMQHGSSDDFFAYPYDSDYDANRSFDEEKWNDWWHDRPDRSYPRWVWRNQNCTPDRMWWSGAGWRCTP